MNEVGNKKKKQNWIDLNMIIYGFGHSTIT